MDKRVWGHPDQRLLLRSMSVEDGAGRGMRVIHVLNSGGLFVEVLPDRGLDIAAASWQGRSLAWLSPAGLRHPNSYEAEGIGWLRGFQGGLLTTCGLDQAGAPCEDEGKHYGLHGRYSYTSAEEVYARRMDDGERLKAEIGGVVRQAALFSENLVLTRKISVSEKVPLVEIEDRVENSGRREEILMLLYHLNFGYPLIEKGTKVMLPKGTKTVPRDEKAAEGIENAGTADAPTKGCKEQVYYHEVPPSKNAEVMLVSPKDWGLKITYSHDVLTELVQWKMMGEGEYVMGIEPATCRVSGRAEERKAGRALVLKPGQALRTRVAIEVLPEA